MQQNRLLVRLRVLLYREPSFPLLFVYRGIRQNGRDAWFWLPLVVLISTGQFASELSALGIRGIWFPFGTRVSRTQHAYAVFAVVLFAYLLRQFFSFARHSVGWTLLE